jgi:glycosyltransferase involved in cell wall biosynthesis
MKIGIACNHSFPHQGGSERVIHQIASWMQNKYNHRCYIYSFTANNSIIDGVSYIDCSKEDLIKESKNLDFLFIYSDYFRLWPTLLNSKLSCKLGIALVGMNYMLSKNDVRKRFEEKIKNIKVLTHDNSYLDYKYCKENLIPVKVINNGVDLNEFKNKDSFKKKYNIDKDIVLCVSNFFPGKGQEYLIKVFSLIKEEIKKYKLVFISSSVNVPIAHILRNNFIKNIKNMNLDCLFLEDINRSDIISAYNDSSLFVFPSIKEVAPLVILEAMASETPWIALPVGNVPSLKGGLMCPVKGFDKNGAIWGPETYEYFSKYVLSILSNKELSGKLKNDGKDLILSKYNWDKISEEYNDYFERF